MEQIKPKMRIQLLTPELVPTSDRLVDQYTELYVTGAKTKHTDPIRLELVLTSQNDIDAFKKYLDQLAGNLPIKETGSRGRPSTASSAPLESPREDILQSVEDMVKEGQDQDQVIEYLRNLGFVFLLTEDFLQYFPDFKFKENHIGTPNRQGQYPKGLCWMVRRVKMAKDPKSDKYDPQIIFGFEMLGQRARKFVAYLYKEYKGRYKANIPDKKALTFASFEMAKMPAYMTEEERLKWSTEMRALMANHEKQPSKFFMRWVADVTLPKGHIEQLSHLPIQFKQA